jgi:cytochrome P450
MLATADASAGTPLRVNPDEFRPDPHAGFARCRPLRGVLDVGGGISVVTRHSDVQALMTDPRTRQMSTEALTMRGVKSGALHDFYAHSMLMSNPPHHTRRRRPAARAFAFKVIDGWRPRIREIVEEMLHAVESDDETDFLAAVASPLPSRMIAEILGAPREDAPEFAAKVYVMSRGIGAFRDEDVPAIDAAGRELTEYVDGLLEERRKSPRDDFLTDYLRRVDEDELFTPAETLIQIVTLILAGSDTTRFGLTATLALLLQHRDQWEALCGDVSLVGGAVEEGLRYEPPVGSIGRVVTEPLEIDGVPLHPGESLALSILSGQRDEAVFEAPQSFDIARSDHPRWSISFGAGPHRCLGEALARAELEEALRAIATRHPTMEQLVAPVTKGHSGIRGITPMIVRLNGAM